MSTLSQGLFPPPSAHEKRRDRAIHSFSGAWTPLSGYDARLDFHCIIALEAPDIAQTKSRPSKIGAFIEIAKLLFEASTRTCSCMRRDEGGRVNHSGPKFWPNTHPLCAQNVRSIQSFVSCSAPWHQKCGRAHRHPTALTEIKNLPLVLFFHLVLDQLLPWAFSSLASPTNTRGPQSTGRASFVLSSCGEIFKSTSKALSPRWALSWASRLTPSPRLGLTGSASGGFAGLQDGHCCCSGAWAFSSTSAVCQC